MKKLLLIIFGIILSFNAYSQCAGVSATGTTKAKTTKSCYDTVVVASQLNTVTADTVTCTRMTVTNLTDGLVKSVSDVLTPAVAGTDYPDASLTSGQVPYANGTKSITSEAAFAYDATNDVLSVPRLTLSGNISASSWTTNGIRYRSTPSRLTNTTSSGTVATVYNNVFSGDTTVSSSSTTITNLYNYVFLPHVAGSNTTITNNRTLGVFGTAEFNGTGARIRFVNSGGSAGIGTDGSDLFNIRTSNTDRINITATGLIGMGVPAPSPNSNLQVAGSFALPYTSKTGTYTIGSTDYTIDCTSGTFTVTLPTAVGITGRIYVVSNTGAGTITLGTTSSQTINGSTTQSIAAGGGYSVQSNGSNWTCVGKW